MVDVYSMIDELDDYELDEEFIEYDFFDSEDIEDLHLINGVKRTYIPYDDLIFLGVFINGEKNGKGKEYNTEGFLLFEGIFSNGKKNGNGKEYHLNGELKFDGDYKEGKEWDGIGYNKKGKIEYIYKNGIKYEDFEKINLLLFGDKPIKNKKENLNGKELNVKKNLNIKEYNSNGTLDYKGEFIKGESYIKFMKEINKYINF